MQATRNNLQVANKQDDRPVKKRRTSNESIDENSQDNITKATKIKSESDSDAQIVRRKANTGSRRPNQRKTDQQQDHQQQPSQALPLSIDPFSFSSSSTQPVPWKANNTRGVGLPGHLKSIEVIDFMCHKHMTMDFAPHITFISGSNGSGKSATLQAIQACLGVKASKTGRATSLKGFIRSGAHEAIIRVTLWNKPYAGFDSFQHDVYGDTITVERRIGTGTTWAMKDHSGRIVARRRDELDAMLSTLSINGANPITVMSQDTARSFLAVSSGKADSEKYELYMEATMLGDISANLTEGRLKLQAMDESAKEIEQRYDLMEKSEAGFRKALESLRGLDEWQKERLQLESILAWKIVTEHRIAAEALKKDLEEVLPGAIMEAEETAEVLAREVSSLEAAVAHKKALLENFDSNSEELSRELAKAKTAAKKAHKEANEKRKKIEKLEKHIEEERLKKDELEVALTQVKNEVFEETQVVATKKYLEELESAQTNKEQEEALLRQRMTEKDAAEAAEQAVVVRMEETQRTSQRLKQELAQLNEEVESLKAIRGRGRKGEAGGNRAQLFGGQAMLKLVSLIQDAANKGAFHRRPIGPVGMYLELSDERWGRAIESAIGQTLSSILVHDQHDYLALSDLINKSGMTYRDRPNIVVMRLDLPRHTVPATSQPPAEVPTMYRVLHCNDASCENAVFNYLIDSYRIERLALADTYEKLKTVARLRSVQSAYMTDGTRRFVRGNSETEQAESPWQRTRAPRFGISPKDQTEQLKSSIAAVQDKIRWAERDIASIQQECHAAHQASVAARRLVAASKSALVGLSSTVSALMSQTADGDEEEEEGNGEGLHAEFIEATQAVIDFEGQLGETKEALEAITLEESDAYRQIEELQGQLKRLEDENAELVNTFEAEAQREAKAKEESQAAMEALHALKGVKHQKEMEKQKQEAAAKAAAEIAEEMFAEDEAVKNREEHEALLREKGQITSDAEIELYFSVVLLKKKIQKLASKIANAERDAGGEYEELQLEHAKAKKVMEEEGVALKTAIDLHAMLRRAYRRREAKMEEVEAAMEKLINKRFNFYMKKKGNLGRMTIDKDAKKLSLVVQIGGSKKAGSGQAKDLKTLSGGERSFTTVAFTLALGAETDMPFRAMDEFDVFVRCICVHGCCIALYCIVDSGSGSSTSTNGDSTKSPDC